MNNFQIAEALLDNIKIGLKNKELISGKLKLRGFEIEIGLCN